MRCRAPAWSLVPVTRIENDTPVCWSGPKTQPLSAVTLLSVPVLACTERRLRSAKKRERKVPSSPPTAS